jgi:heat shock protein HtpX
MREGSRYMAQFAITIALEIALSVLGMIVVAYFSRLREFRADRGGAQLAGREKMIDALQGLRQTVELVDTQQASLATLKISGKPGGFAALFATHPPLEARIRALRAG